MIEPRGGRLLTFTGGLENLHGVRRVTAGTRYVIGMWFTCHEELEYHDDEEDERASGGVLERVLAGVLLEEYFEYSVVIKCSGVLEGVSKTLGRADKDTFMFKPLPRLATLGLCRPS